MSTVKEMEEQVLKVKERSRERLRQLKELQQENKELRIHNQFLIDRLEVWAERNFEERQKNINMTLDEVIEQSKTKKNYLQEKELAKTVDEVAERGKNLNTKGMVK